MLDSASAVRLLETVMGRTLRTNQSQGGGPVLGVSIATEPGWIPTTERRMLLVSAAGDFSRRYPRTSHGRSFQVFKDDRFTRFAE